MNTELNSLLSDFKNQLNIPEHELQSLRGFFNFLRNRDALADDELIPYGMLVQYDEEESLEIFKQVLKKVPDKLETTEPYRIFTVKEDKYYNLSIAPDRRDILVITDCSEDDSLELMMQRFNSTPDVVKIICAPSSVVENRFKKDDHFFYRMLSRHLHLEKLRSSEITGQFLSYMNTKGYTVSQDFVDEIGYYIDSIYDEADFRNRDFVLDLMRRIELQMEENEGILAYRKGLTVDNSFIPYSKKVNLRREQKEEEQKQTQAETEALFKDDTPEKHAPSDKHYNVLLLALSTFGRNVNPNKFIYVDENGKEDKVIGRYQLDPVPKMLYKTLYQKEQGTLDKIIMLCTSKTLEKVAEVPIGTEKIYDISPIDYFKDQIRDYMRPDADDEELFQAIEVDLTSPYHGIQSVITTLRSIKAAHEDQTLNLYLDTHGGLRGIQRIMEATVSLLKSEDIDVREAYAVEYSDNGTKSIVSETENMKIYDFVSGVNEFFSCGRADTLMKYKENLEQTHETKKESSSKNIFTKEENQLITAISDVATGIQWCSIPAFDQGIKDLQKIFPETSESTAKNTSTESSDTKNIDKGSYLDIYRTNIQKDYSTLLKKNHTVLDEIEWCINKGFYQQALTLIESKISGLLVYDLKLFTFTRPQGIKQEKDGKTIHYSYTCINKNNNEVKKTFTINNVFNDYIYAFNRIRKSNNNSNEKFTIEYNKPWIGDENFNKLTVAKYENFKQTISYPTGINISDIFENASSHLSSKDYDKFNENTNDKIPWKNSLKMANGLDSGKQNLLFKILVLHKTLKRVRNNMNHAADDSPFKVPAINLALTEYMSWLRRLC
mgnify:FL=1